MFLNNYASNFSKAINLYSATETIISSKLLIDANSESVGLLTVEIVFTDESKLFVTEFVDVSEKIDKLSYSYHYQDKTNSLIFRYDNSSHKPRLPFTDHKHIDGKIIKSAVPNINDVLEEILTHIAF